MKKIRVFLHVFVLLLFLLSLLASFELILSEAVIAGKREMHAEVDQYLLANQNPKSEVYTILNYENSFQTRLDAVQRLELDKNWQNLLLVMPPRGKHDAISEEVVSAIGRIGNTEALADLKYLYNSDHRVSGKFWVRLQDVIHELEQRHNQTVESK